MSTINFDSYLAAFGGSASDAWESLVSQADDLLGSSGRDPRKGCLVTFSGGTYRFVRDMIVNRPFILRGEGTTSAIEGATVFEFASGCGVIVPGHKDDRRGGGIGYGARFESIVVRGGTGIRFNGRASAEDCYVTFSETHGWTIDGHNGNTNSWKLEQCGAHSNAGRGFYVSGADANGGIAISCHSHSNGEGGFFDGAHLLNTYIGCTAHEYKGPPYESANDSARMVLISCYREGGGPPSKLKYADVWGGNLLYDKKSRSPKYAAGRYDGKHTFRNEEVDALLGDHGLDGAAVGIKSPDGEWVVGYDKTTGCAAFAQSRVGPKAFRVTGPKSKAVGGKKLAPNLPWFGPYYFGPVNYPVAHIYTVTGEPPAGPFDHGARCVNLKPKVGQPGQWVWVDGAWRAESRIE